MFLPLFLPVPTYQRAQASALDCYRLLLAAGGYINATVTVYKPPPTPLAARRPSTTGA
jgi:hypothetical protein